MIMDEAAAILLVYQLPPAPEIYKKSVIIVEAVMISDSSPTVSSPQNIPEKYDYR